MQSALRKGGLSPYSLSVMTSILLVAVTAYPQSLDRSASFEKMEKVCTAHYMQPLSNISNAPHK